MSANGNLAARVARLEAKVELLESERPGRKPKPIVVSVDGVCGIDPERDSATCPDATLYRYQHGCKGTRCKKKNTDYYRTRRSLAK